MSSTPSAALTMEPLPQNPRPSTSLAGPGPENMPASPAGGGLAQTTACLPSAPNPRPTPGPRVFGKPRKRKGTKNSTDTCGEEGGAEEYELREVCGAVKRPNGSLAYQCLWEDYPSDDCTWEPAENFLSKASQAICMGYVKRAKTAGTWGANWEPPSFP